MTLREITEEREREDPVALRRPVGPVGGPSVAHRAVPHPHLLPAGH